MGKLVNLLGAGIGFTSEAIQAARSRSREPSSAQPSTSSTPHDPQDAPPAYGDSIHPTDYGESSRSTYAQHDLTGPDKKHRSKAAEAGYDSESDSSDSDHHDVFEQDEAEWELDEMAERVRPPTYEESEALPAGVSEGDRMMREEQMIRELVQMAGPSQPSQRLPCPVIIPQRRPRKKQYGFVRAYAPVLTDCGVSQEVFLQFLVDWEKASKSDKWIDVVFLAGNVIGFVPELAAQIIGPIVAAAAGTAREIQSRSRRNTFLDKFNEDILMPRGLFGMVMSFKESIPGEQKGALQKLSSTIGQTIFTSKKLSIDEVAAKYSNPDPNLSKTKQKMSNIRLASGRIDGEVELPEAAELIYPDIDRFAEQAAKARDDGKEASMGDKFKNASSWVQDYFDRRGQAFHDAENNDPSRASQSTQQSQFRSRYNDPNHPANSGSLVALLTGGAINPVPRREDRRRAKRERRNDRRVARGRPARDQRQKKKRRKGTVKRLLQGNILYFFIVNIPSQEEVQQSVDQLERLMSEQEAPSSSHSS
ncbi:unnamed protein product [Penicillium pancosmium]